MRIVRLATVSVLLLAVLSGCSDSPDQPEAAGSSGTGAPAAGAGSWVHAAFNGDFETTALADPEPAAEPRLLAAAVPEGAVRSLFNITVAGDLPDEVDVRLIADGCDSQDCWEEGTTQGGQVSLDVDEPLTGDWQLVLFASTAAQRGSYDVSVDSFVPA
jgi:hypothetical protein